jgi:amidase
VQYETVEQVLAALKVRAVSSIELVDSLIAKIEAIDSKLNAIVVRDFDRARAAAKAADEARARGEDEKRPLLGVPVTVKEAIDVAGLPTTWGLPGTQDAKAARDAVVVERLKAAGAVMLGKTNVAMMLSDWQTANPVYGRTNHPVDVSRTAGGSSGGGAAALAAGLTLLECGSDLAGSLRIPASFCGVFAHRPTFGLIPMRGFAPPGAPREEIGPNVDQSVLGPMARSASDLMRALDVLAGPDEDAAHAWELRLPAPRAEAIDGFRVLIVDEHPLVPTAESIRSALSTLATALERAGCKVGRVSAGASARTNPGTGANAGASAGAGAGASVAAGAAASAGAGAGAGGNKGSKSIPLPDMKELSTLFGDLLMAFFSADMPEQEFKAKRASVMTHREWIHADRRRYAFAAQWRRLFNEWDVVLCPAAPVVAFPHDDRPFDQRTMTIDGQSRPYHLLPMWTAWPTPTGQPVTTMPIGRDEAGLPIGMQIIGPRLEDRTPIAFAGMVARLIWTP